MLAFLAFALAATAMVATTLLALYGTAASSVYLLVRCPAGPGPAGKACARYIRRGRGERRLGHKARGDSASNDINKL